MNDIVCAKTGRHFSGVDAARECVKEHDHCNACPWESSNVPIHFIPRKQNVVTQQDIERLMGEIRHHLAQKRKIVIPVKLQSDDNPFDSNHIGYYKGEYKIRQKGKIKSNESNIWWWILGVLLVLVILWIIYGGK